MTYEEYATKRDELIHSANANEICSDEYHRQMDMLASEYYGDE